MRSLPMSGKADCWSGTDPNPTSFSGLAADHRASSYPQTFIRVPERSQPNGTRFIQSSITAFPNAVVASSEQKRIPFSEIHGRLRLIAAADGGSASLRLHQDVRLYSSLLDRGHHVVHALGLGRGAWLQVVEGRIQLIDQALESGDGASIEDEAAVSFTVQEPSEILLFDLP